MKLKQYIPPGTPPRIRHPLIALICFAICVPFAIAHVEIPFIFRITHDFILHPEQHLLALPLVKGILVFDFVFLFPLLLVSFFIFLYFPRKNKLSTEQLYAFMGSAVYSFLFLLGMYSKNPPYGIFVLLAASLSFFTVSYFLFKLFLEKNPFSKLVIISVVAAFFFFFVQRVSFYEFVVDYVTLFVFSVLFLKVMSDLPMIRKMFLLVLFVVFFAEWFVYLQSYAPVPAKKVESLGKYKSRPNIVLIVLDTLRADYIELLPGGTTPFIASFAVDSVVYKNCLSTSSWTRSAHASMFTGLYPTTHGAHLFGEIGGKTYNPDKYGISYPLSQNNVTLAEVLSKYGYRTYGVVANHAHLHHTTGIAQGFELYDDRYLRPLYRLPLADMLLHIPKIAGIVDRFSRFSGFYESSLHYRYKSKRYRVGEDINKSVKSILKQTSEPFFLFVNYMDTHDPYIPTKEYRMKFPGKIKDKFLSYSKEVLMWDTLMSKKRHLSIEENEHLHATYKGEVMYADAQVGDLLDFLKSSGLYDESMIIITSDHGDFLGEHSLMRHQCGLYQQVLQVPLIIKYPEAKKTGVVSKTAQLLDVFPTVLKQLNIAIPPLVEGYPLDEIRNLKWGELRLRGTPTQRLLVAEQYENRVLFKRFGERFRGLKRALFLYPYKYIASSAFKGELYDLSSDPGESINLADKKADIAAQMLEILDTWLSKRKPVARKRRPEKLGKDAAARLRALGYL